MTGEFLAVMVVLGILVVGVTWLKVTSRLLDRELRISQLERKLRSVQETELVSKDDAERAMIAAFAMGVAAASSLSLKRGDEAGTDAGGSRSGPGESSGGVDLAAVTAATSLAIDP